jgi:beta-glucosidase
MEGFKLPKDFLMGSATAALQIEGGDRNNNWYRWCEEGNIKDGTHCINANDHWNRYEDDIAIMKELNHDTYRMGLEWSRIEPKEGIFSEEGIKHYRNEIRKLKENNIRPLVTLHHFSHPLWLEDMEGWENPKVVKYYKRYVEFVVNRLGDLVSDWITINEPNVFLVGGYIDGIWPPGKQSIGSMLKAMKNMIKAHIEGYKTIHRVRKERGFDGDTLVGVANHLRVFEAENNKVTNKIPARLIDYFFHTVILEGMTKGRFKLPIGVGHYPLKEGRYYDFIGINYYSRDIIKFSLNISRMFGETKVKDDAEVNDLGWEIYPEGLYRICKKYYGKYNAPIFITENGICDEKDEKRPKFIYDHLKQISRLIEEGIPVQRYYHWTLIDNFEWIEGENARFGLVHNDFKTQKRTIRNSGRFYGEICKYKAITEDMIERYILKRKAEALNKK